VHESNGFPRHFQQIYGDAAWFFDSNIFTASIAAHDAVMPIRRNLSASDQAIDRHEARANSLYDAIVAR